METSVKKLQLFMHPKASPLPSTRRDHVALAYGAASKVKRPNRDTICYALARLYVLQRS